MRAPDRPRRAPSAQRDGSAEGRIISGMIVFDERITAAQRQRVTVNAKQRIEGQAEWQRPTVDAAQISYDASTGEYAIVDLEPGRYSLEVLLRDDTSGWSFWPGTEPTTSWDGSSTGGSGWREVGVVDADSTGQTLHFSGIGGVGLNLISKRSAFGGDVKVFMTNTANGASAQFVPGSCGAGAEGNFSYVLRTALSGTRVTVRVVTEGVTVYYDGSKHGTRDASKAKRLTLPVQKGLELGTMDVRKWVKGDAPKAEWLTADTRGGTKSSGRATAGEKVRVFAGKNFNGKNRAGELAFGWYASKRVALGMTTVGKDGYATFALPVNRSGKQRLVVA